jgi:dCMP deaminase
MLMGVAELIAQRGTCLRSKVGAILARDGRILSSGYVGAPTNMRHCSPGICRPDTPCTRTIHAEANAIAWAARTGVETMGSTMYVTVSPCGECAKLLINAGIVQIYYGVEYRDAEPIKLLRHVGIYIHECPA